MDRDHGPEKVLFFIKSYKCLKKNLGKLKENLQIR